jgi:hypothetical protein
MKVMSLQISKVLIVAIGVLLVVMTNQLVSMIRLKITLFISSDLFLFTYLKGENRTKGCIARGPGNNMYESTFIIGKRQYEKAYELFNKNHTHHSLPATGVFSCGMYIDMRGHQVIFLGFK